MINYPGKDDAMIEKQDRLLLAIFLKESIRIMFFKHRSVTTELMTFPFFAFRRETSISIAKLSRDPDAGNCCKFRFQLSRSRLRRFVSQLLTF